MNNPAEAKNLKSSFPITQRPRRGYDTKQVDAFLNRAKVTFEEPENSKKGLTSGELRRASFKLKRRGYEPRFVDSALDRLEEVFFERERRGYIRSHGQQKWAQLLSSLERDIYGRMNRDHGERFKRRSFFAHGYRRSQVDAALDQIARAFQQGNQVKTADVRNVRFHLQRNGYDEAQVDAYLDAVVEYLLAKR